MTGWRPVVGYEATHQVSDDGRVWSRPRFGTKGGDLKLRHEKGGHLFVRICADGIQHYSFVHVLMLETFIGPRPPGQQARHLDGNPSNNVLENLCWGTPSENQLDSVHHGTHAASKKTHCPQGHKYTEENTQTRPSKGRECRICERKRVGKWQTQNRDRRNASRRERRKRARLV